MEEPAVAGFRTSPQQRSAWRRPDAWIQLTVGLDGPVDPVRLSEAVASVRQRHEILRTSVTEIPGQPEPVQAIGESAEGLDDVVDLAATGQDPEQVAQAERAQVRPGMGHHRIVLIRLSPDLARLVLTAHPLVADRSSLWGVCQEVVSTFAGDALPSVELQHADFAAWHNDLLDDPQRGNHRQFWDSHLEPLFTTATAEMLAPPPHGSPAGWASIERRLGRETAEVARGVSADVSAGPHDVVATAWAFVLWRLGGERDLLVAAADDGRSREELAGAVGPYSRDLPLVCRFEPAESFRSAVVRMRDAVAEAKAHHEDLDPIRLAEVGPVPAFEAVDDPGTVVSGGLSLRMLDYAHCPAVPLSLTSRMGADGLSLRLGYDPAALAGTRAEALLDRCVTALAQLLREPDATLDGVSLLLPGEAETLLAQGEGPTTREADPADVGRAISAQARRTPEATALDDGSRRLSYAELDNLAGGYAVRLAEGGVRPGDRVALWLPRGCEAVIAMLAVLKAGAAYVPIDIRQPVRRVAFVAADAGAKLVLTAAGASAEGLQLPVLEIDLEAPPADLVTAVPGADPERVAYVMYTSGSTGRPNGVPVTHKALLNYLLWASETYDLQAGAGAIAHSSIGFDLTVTTMLAPLLVGQRVRLVPEGPGLDHFVRAIRSEPDITLLKATPTQLAALIDVVGPNELAQRIRTLVLGGEALRAETIAPLLSAGANLRIVNEYGPTETVVGSCAYDVDHRAAGSGAVPIGTPIAGTRIYLLDALGRPVPDGVPGEIFIGGAGVAAGYVNRPELTAERFVAGAAGDGERVYRTGDRARRTAGQLVYLGRMDDQLKVLGVRIEPGEIEAILAQHPDVAGAAVVAWQPGGAQAPVGLAALVVTETGRSDPDRADLAAHCRERLPDYLVPMLFVPAPHLPVNAHGKLDRKAAAAAIAAHAQAQTPFAPPSTDTERILAEAIAKVLGRDQVGIDDNYFAIGGDSIRSVMVASRAQAAGVALSVADLHRLPTVRRLAEALSQRESELAEPLTEPFSLISAEDRAVMPPDVEDAFPLNLLQEGMIFHRDFAAKSAVYHAIASVRLKAPFDLDIIRRVINELVQRHPMLRTSFDQTTFSKPLQLVHRTFRDPLGFEDLRGQSEAAQQARIEAFVLSEKERGFELDEYPLIRFMVHRLDEESFQFTYGFHHEIVDGWSEALMVTEIFGHYFSLVYGEPIAPRPPTSTMRDAVALELQALEQPENFEFWSDYLSDATLMRLPRLGSGPTADKGAREIVRIAVPVSPELSDELKRLALRRSVPLKSVLLAAHMAVMQHYHGQNDTLTYTVTNGRPESADGSTAIGLFVNSLALRVRMDGGTWSGLIDQTLDSERRSLPYRRLPMAELKRHQGNEPLAETLFFFTDYHVFRELDRWRERGVDHVASELYGESTFPFCAIFRLNRDTSQLEVRLEYDSLQFQADLMERLGDSYRRALEAIAADPESTYHGRSLLSEEEARLLADIGDGGAAMGGEETIDQVFRRQAAATPDAVALRSESGAFTYAALDRWADSLARQLRAEGGGPERLVGILAERSAPAVAAILAILRSGAAYLPLDPGQPDERINAIVADARPLLVLAPAESTHRITAGPSRVLTEKPLKNAATAPPATPSNPDTLAYVIYTSGSTGAPKGVAVTHRNLVSSTLARTGVYPGAPTRFLLLSPLVFDSSVAGLFWPLCTGGTLHLPAEGAQLEPAHLLDYLKRHEITHTLCVPSLLAALLEPDRPDALRSLETVIVAGEAGPSDLYSALRRLTAGCRLYNEYGPTENTVWSTVWSGQPPEHRPQLPIGRPVAGVRAHVLNEHLNRVPVGVAAELYLAGAGVARGYLGDAARTAERFRPDPYSPVPGGRAYRSGDLVRHDTSGDLEFLGRLDNQVKIRGFRVELGEIEGILDTHPDVHRCVLVARDLGNGEKSLVAYVVARAGAAIEAADVQRYLRDRVPKYMVPAAVSVLEALPLTRTGKVDRMALPAVEAPGRSAAPAPPETETQHVVAAIWCQTLGLDEVGIHETFFDVGGESLRAMQVVTRTNKVFGLNISVRALFDAATVAAFAELVDTAREVSALDTPAGRAAG